LPITPQAAFRRIAAVRHWLAGHVPEAPGEDLRVEPRPQHDERKLLEVNRLEESVAQLGEEIETLQPLLKDGRKQRCERLILSGPSVVEVQEAVFSLGRTEVSK
jgi:hypothetical protein